MSKDEKYDELVEFIKEYKEEVENLDITSYIEDKLFKKGELLGIRTILRKIDRLEKINSVKSSL